MKRYGDMVCGITGLILAAVIFTISVQIGLKEGDAIGADFLPKIVSIIIFLFSGVLAWRGFQNSKNYVAQPMEYPSNPKGVIIMIIACFIYAMLLKPVGFIITSMVFLFLAICLMTKKEKINYVKTVIITFVAVMAIYLIFSQIFSIRLPHGIL